ncbi:MAG: hypothetical protein U9Q66_02435, partial [Patescibacteria group bacterium]|nr:hypothetical protein [Patescibacteria group bacterium]
NHCKKIEIIEDVYVNKKYVCERTVIYRKVPNMSMYLREGINTTRVTFKRNSKIIYQIIRDNDKIISSICY